MMDSDTAGGAGPSEPPATAHAARKPATGAPKKLVIKAFKGALAGCTVPKSSPAARLRAWLAIATQPLRVRGA